ncbi:MAG: glycosyltransferase [Sphingobacteriia bacterium]|nr:glycosyltransferase [Sphingobacteriia bacterium]NCC40719.1 glycosyltransferase [Gammaproteobacteria bacterium]
MSVDRIALLVSGFEDGGVERNFTSLAAGLSDLGVAVDLLVGDPGHPYLRELLGRVKILPLSADPCASLQDYLSRQPPAILLTGKLKDDAAALAAKQRLGVETRLVAAVGTLMSGRFAAHPWNIIKRLRETRHIHRIYERLDGITALTEHVARDLREHFKLSAVPIKVLCNPIIPPDLTALASAQCAHPWLAPGEPPVILATGGLRRVKDFPTLLRAFARLLSEREARLLILGEGKERTRLAALARRLGVAAHLDLHGFVPNPFPYMARSRVLALSSRREGLGNVLVEAMAVGTPVVATDCTEGIRDLLRNGTLGALVPVGDDRALARALADTLATRPDPARLQAATRPFARAVAAQAYLDYFTGLLSGAR